VRVHDETMLVARLISSSSLSVVRGAEPTDHLRGDEVVVLAPLAYTAPPPTLSLTPAFSLATNASEVRAGGSSLDLSISGLNATLLPSPHTLRALGVSGTAGRLRPEFDGPGDGPAYPGVMFDVFANRSVLQPSTLNPQPSTLNPQPSTLNPQPSTLNPQPSTHNPQP